MLGAGSNPIELEVPILGGELAVGSGVGEALLREREVGPLIRGRGAVGLRCEERRDPILAEVEDRRPRAAASSRHTVPVRCPSRHLLTVRTPRRPAWSRPARGPRRLRPDVAARLRGRALRAQPAEDLRVAARRRRDCAGRNADDDRHDRGHAWWDVERGLDRGIL